MKYFKNISVLSQLKLVYILLVLVVVSFAMNSYRQSEKLHEQTVLLGEHPLQVRAAIADIELNLLQIELLFTAKNDLVMVEKVDSHLFVCETQFEIIEKKYLGPKIDYLNANNRFLSVKSHFLRHMPSEDKKEETTLWKANFNSYINALNTDLKVIDQFAQNKSEAISKNSNIVFKELNLQNLTLMILVLFTLGILGKYMYGQFKTPLLEINHGIADFHAGKISHRISVQTENEFGFLAKNLNALFGWIEEKNDLAEQELRLNNLMIEESSLTLFLAKILNMLRISTNAQLGAFFLKDEVKDCYKSQVSIGMDISKIPALPIHNPGGEAGLLLVERKIIKISQTSDFDHMNFSSLAGEIRPKEIVLIPFFKGFDLFGYLSLASVNSIDEKLLRLLEKVQPGIQSRLIALIAEEQMHVLNEKLALQNNELRTQRNELSRQSEEVSEQNRELEMQKNQLTETNRFKTSFLSNMSHELRTPLNSVIALSGVLNRKLAGKIPEDEYNYLDVIERNGKHLLNLINDILDISRIEAGKEEVYVEQFPIDRLMQQLKDLTEQQANQKGLAFDIMIDPTNLQLQTDYRKCLQVLTNLVGNAIKFTEEGKITLHIGLTNSHVLMEVMDTGIGINPDQIAHIFDEFKQGDESTSKRFGGTGLGLTIARKYAVLMGGNVLAKSNLSKGSIFQFLLPLSVVMGIAESGDLLQAPKVDVSNNKLLEHKSILLVDDSEPALLQLTYLCKQLGLDVLTARNAEEAIQIINNKVPDAIVLDLMMPHVSGFELLNIIRSAEPSAGIPVLVLTAKEISSDELKLLKRNNVHQLIQKGDIQASELQWKLSKLIAKEQELTRVLHVEDNEDNRLTIKAILEGMYDLRDANDGKMGIEMAKSWRPELILMDIALPLMNGIDAMKEIRKDPGLENVPIIAISAFGSNYEKSNLLEVGFNGFLSKPIDPKQLLNLMKEILYGK